MTHEAAPASPESLGVSQDELIPTPASKSADLDAEPSGLAGLLARVEAATGGDRELDLLLAQAFDGLDPRACASPKGIIGYVDRGQWAQPFVPPYTASLDAALALCERVLPGRAGDLIREALSAVGQKHALHIRFWKPAEDGSYVQALALALLAAMLKALDASTAGPATGSSHRLDEPLLSKGGGESSSREPSPSIRGVVRGGTEP